MPELTNYTPSPAIDPRDLQTRKELLPAQETTEDMYRPDTIADPEGVARRAENLEYEPWVFNNYQLSRVDVYGYAWPDSKMHLIPTKSYIQDIMQTYKMLMTDESYMTVCLEAGKKDEDFETIKSAYTSLVSSIQDGNGKLWPITKSITEICQNALAERAYRYHIYQEANARAEMQSDTAEMPDWLLPKETNFSDSSRIAGIWLSVYQAVQNITGYKSLDFTSEISLNITEKNVKKLVAKSAKYVEENYKTLSSSKITAKESRLIKG